MADSLVNDKSNLPQDLQIAPQPQTSKDYYNFKATKLKIDTTYSIKFQWVFQDGTTSDWSNGYPVLVATENVPGAPTATIPSTGSGVIPVTLSSFPTNAKRVDVVVIGGIYGIGKVAYSFFATGTHNIPVAAGEYTVVLLAVTPSNINGDPTSTFSITVTDPTANLQVDPSVTPSTPTVSSVLGAIQLAWNGKTATGGDQPNGFVAAKVYVGTTSGFTPIDIGQTGANQVDVLNFGNGQNTLNIAVGTLVNGVAMTYNTNYYVKIKTTNGNPAQDSAAVLATGSPAQIGKAGSGDIISITADQITTGTISSQVVTVGSASGKHVKLSGTGDPITVYGTGGTSDPLLSFSTNGSGQSVLTIKGNGSFSGDISAATGTLTNALNIGAYDLVTWGGRGYPFSVNSSGNIEAGSGKIGGWTINSTQLRSTGTNYITLNPSTPRISLVKGASDIYSATGTITIDPIEGIKDSVGNFTLTPAGNLTLKGSITTGSTITGAELTLTGNQSGTGSGGSYTQNSDNSNKITWTAAEYVILPSVDTWTETIITGSYYNDATEEWITTTTTNTISKKMIKFTDASYKGSVPPTGSGQYYGEVWMEAGTNWGAATLYANGNGEYWGIEVRKSSSDAGFYLNAPTTNFTDTHLSSTGKDQPAYLQADSTGKITRGRAIFTGGSNNPSTSIGQNGDLYFSTAV